MPQIRNKRSQTMCAILNITPTKRLPQPLKIQLLLHSKRKISENLSLPFFSQPRGKSMPCPDLSNWDGSESSLNSWLLREAKQELDSQMLHCLKCGLVFIGFNSAHTGPDPKSMSVSRSFAFYFNGSKNTALYTVNQVGTYVLKKGPKNFTEARLGISVILPLVLN